MSEQEPLYPPASKELAAQRKTLAPQTAEAFKAFSQSVFADGALPAKTKQLIALAVSIVVRCRRPASSTQDIRPPSLPFSLPFSCPGSGYNAPISAPMKRPTAARKLP